ncbi:hypothetical protein FFA43_09030 (plasmid) [Campylobacter hyointestinalis subsp. hyointestinalis]|uniref:hypothetical protein n=1 Tax=Campylobacter hyointestinalis TaxID=198 RepID=UPI0007253A42|nr:hypothetical protein [Campylobacter hyointestinalis]PPB57244.1 hypothetical protein CDQ71_07550 [Campylobacter hyointestinalis subsp. hyointestinalis]QCU00834.1 hypothetical protein FFA43_09030 [Campylobacter hyointestinalis subsp. hyointestinalis]TWO20030.1 hypothetical protein YZ80_06410 [Campylobacter hyointestinalis]CUU86697.1 Uncharacterised protein [Campylobacter hyointestinalis subsp. hyointestinalis]
MIAHILKLQNLNTDDYKFKITVFGGIFKIDDIKREILKYHSDVKIDSELLSLNDAFKTAASYTYDIVGEFEILGENEEKFSYKNIELNMTNISF